MALHVIAGRANAGKTGLLYGELKRVISGGMSAMLVVPSVPDVARARSELGTALPLGVRAFTFSGFLEYLWQLHGDGRPICPSALRRATLRSIERQQRNSLPVGELADACIGVLSEQVGAQWRSAPASARAPESGRPLADLLVEYAANPVASEHVEPAEAAHLLAESAGARFADLIVFHRFSDFTHSQRRLVRACGDRGEVMLSLTWERDFAPTKATDSLVEDLRPEETTVLSGRPFNTHPTLEALAENLFDEPCGLSQHDGAVRFYLAEGAEAEACRIAEEVVEAIKDGVASSHERIAVAFRDAGPYYLALKHAFAEAGLSADWDIPLPFASAPLGNAYLDALAFAISGQRKALVSLLRSPYSGTNRAATLEIEHRWRRRGTTDRSTLLREVRHLNPELVSLLERLGRIHEISIDTTTHLVALSSTLMKGRYGCDMTGGGDDAEVDARAHSAVVGLADSVSAPEPAGFILADVVDALRSVQLVPHRVERPGHVQVMSVPRMRGRRFDVVIVGGLEAGAFPAPTPETMLPGSAVAAVLEGFGGRGEVRQRLLFEQLMFYECITRATQRLVLGAKTTDSAGEQVRLSPLFETVADFFRGQAEDAGLPPHAFKSAAEPPSDKSLASARDSARAAAYVGDRTDPAAAAAIRRCRARPGSLSDPAVAVGDSSRPFTPSAIEAYLQCPYKWFYERVLSPRDVERGFDAREQGELAHVLLAKTYERLIAEEMLPLSSRTLTEAHALLDEVSAELVVGLHDCRSVEGQVGRRRALAWAHRAVDADAERGAPFVPTHIEWAFGGDDAQLSLGSFELRGRVDRIDVDEGGRAVVIDYKRSAQAEHGADRMLENGRVQIPLYLEAVRRGLGLEPVAGVYRGLCKGRDRGLFSAGGGMAADVRKDAVPDEAFEDVIREALQMAESATEGMRAGYIEPHPLSRKTCVTCPVPSCAARRA